MVFGEGGSWYGKADLVGVVYAGGGETAIVLVCRGLGAALRVGLYS